MLSGVDLHGLTRRQEFGKSTSSTLGCTIQNHQRWVVHDHHRGWRAKIVPGLCRTITWGPIHIKSSLCSSNNVLPGVELQFEPILAKPGDFKWSQYLPLCFSQVVNVPFVRRFSQEMDSDCTEFSSASSSSATSTTACAPSSCNTGLTKESFSIVLGRY